MVKLPNPFHASHGGFADRFFLHYLSAVWLRDVALADQMLRAYTAQGYNHITVGSVGPETYSNHYPIVHWIAEGADRLAAYLQWLVSHGVDYTLVVGPEMEPYFYGTGKGWNWTLVERDVTPILMHPVVQALTRRTMTSWEEYASTSEMCHLFRYMRWLFPKAERLFHNPPGHLSPANGDEDEQAAHRECAKAGMTGMAPQTHAADDIVAGISPLVRAVYDVNDMARRYQGRRDSPWGAPFFTPDGKPLTVEFMEGLAHRDYWEGIPTPDDGPTWRRAMLAIPGVVNCLDA